MPASPSSSTPLLSQSQPEATQQPSYEPLSVTHTPSDSPDKPHHLPNKAGFVNPWPSWVKPSLYELWSGCDWQTTSTSAGTTPSPSTSTSPPPLKVVTPDFSPPSKPGIRTWWLGHAGVLLEFYDDTRPLRVLFDPILSPRASPTQWAGPLRSYAAPCTVEDLPPIDIVLISHNHYDHLDADTVRRLWQVNQTHLHFVVPLGNKAWMQALIGSENTHRISECDWWDELLFHQTSTDDDITLRIACTPAQHSSGRTGYDGSTSLWCSYTLFYNDTQLFFGGDTGNRLRLPPPASPTAFPACPAFEQIHNKYGPPDFLFLPISVGGTYSYIKSWDPVGILPNISGGLTAQNHLDEWEAISVAQVLCGGQVKRNVKVVAIHFGTFSTHAETQRNIDTLDEACQSRGWEMVRPANSVTESTAASDASADHKSPRFYVLNHGGSLSL